MATIKIILYKSKKYKDKTSPVLLRLTINRKIRNFSLPDNYTCLPGQWDRRNSRFNFKYPDYDEANERIDEFVNKAKKIVRELNKKNNDEGFTHDEFAVLYRKKNNQLYLFQYFDQIITRLDKAGKIGNRDVYQDTKNQFETYFGDPDRGMSKITIKDLNLFVEQCQAKGLKESTVHFRLRTLRSLFNKARKEEGLENYPFEKFDWSQLSLETEKRAISKDDLLKIYNHKMEPNQPGFDSRNYFLFSYFCYGLNFGDMTKLEPENIVSDGDQKTLRYYRSKTKKFIRVPLSEYALEILKYYQDSNFGNKYLFPILNPEIHVTPQQIRNRIKTALKKFNADLRELALTLEIDKHITSYVARHSFATILKKSSVATAIISEMMGHKSESVTQTYLDEFDISEKSNAAKNLI